MDPPDVAEEITYAWLLVGKLDEAGKHDKAQALADIIERAHDWDGGSRNCLKELFTKGYITIAGDTERFTEHFGRDGVFPERADTDDSPLPYKWRWHKAPYVKRLSELPKFGAGHVIDGSADMLHYNGHTLVLREETLEPEERKPENLLWQPCEYADDRVIFRTRHIWDNGGEFYRQHQEVC
jgi:hypothetical protein